MELGYRQFPALPSLELENGGLIKNRRKRFTFGKQGKQGGFTGLGP